MDDAPRPQITSMLAPEPDKEFGADLPDSTANPLPTEPQKRKRRTRAELEAAGFYPKLGTAPASVEVTDPKLEKIKRKFAAMGGGQMVKAGFSRLTPDKPLNDSEAEDVDDYFYMVAAKGGIDPSKNWYMMFLTLFCLLLRLVLTRTDMFDKLKELVSPEKPQQKVQDEHAAQAS